MTQKKAGGRKRRRARYQRAIRVLLCVLIVLLTAILLRLVLEDGKEPVSANRTDTDTVKNQSGEPEGGKLQKTEELQENTRKEGKKDPEQISGKEIPLSGYSIHEGDLILVNAQHGVAEVPEPETACVYDEKTESFYAKDRNVVVKKELMDPLNRMLDEFCKKSGKSDVMVNSGYRTESYQKKLYKRDLKENNSNSSEFVAKPGYSEHQTGLAMDFGVYKPSHTGQEYDGTGAYKWINEHCGEFGFVVRYPQGKETETQIGYEPWHFRYVGLPHSCIMAEKGMCLEEYIDFVTAYSPEKPYQYQDGTGKTYEVSYIPETEESVWIPEGKEFYISGNNVDGFILTVF